MSALSERSRRSTAGRRITILSGEALEQDESFWGHETWVEDGSGNESFHSSDEDSELKRDEFDSDFDDTESDNEADELEAGENEERELMRQERDNRTSSTRQYVDEAEIKKTSISPRKGKKAKGGSKRVVGEGLNSGIVLNIPTTLTTNSSDTLYTNVNGVVRPQPVDVISSSPAVSKTKAAAHTRKLENKVKITAAATRPTRPSIRQGRQNYLNQKASNNNDSGKKQTSGARRKRRRYTQEELLMEAVTVTEPENGRWILARKRLQAEQEKNKESFTRETRGTVIERFVSRRGYLNIINFPDMDHLPPILSRNSQIEYPPQLLCVITGKPARYRDPKTQLGYYDVDAFKELRRRVENNEIKVSEITETKKQIPQLETKSLSEDLLPSEIGLRNNDKPAIKKSRRGRPPKKVSTKTHLLPTDQSIMKLTSISAAQVDPSIDVALSSAAEISRSCVSDDRYTERSSLKVESNTDLINWHADKVASVMHVVENNKGSGSGTQFDVTSNSSSRPAKTHSNEGFAEVFCTPSIVSHINGKDADYSRSLQHATKAELKTSVYIESLHLYANEVESYGNGFSVSPKVKVSDPVEKCLSP